MTLNSNWDKVGGEARTEEYRTWRTKLEVGAVGDIEDEEHPGGVRNGGHPSENFLAAVEAKVADTRPQGRMARYIAGELKIPIYLVVYIYGHLDRLWVKQLGTDKGWRRFTTEQFEKGLYKLHRR